MKKLIKITSLIVVLSLVMTFFGEVNTIDVSAASSKKVTATEKKKIKKLCKNFTDFLAHELTDVVEILKIKTVENILVMNIASIPQDNPQGTTINLLAPLVFNLDEKIAGQIILSGSGYDISFPLFKKD